MAARSRMREKASLGSLSRMMVCPRTVTELIGPAGVTWLGAVHRCTGGTRERDLQARGNNALYASLCVVQWSYSMTPGLGMSVALPNMGQPLGPGGRGRAWVFLRNRFCTAYVIRRPRAPRASVAASPMVPEFLVLTGGKLG